MQILKHSKLEARTDIEAGIAKAQQGIFQRPRKRTIWHAHTNQEKVSSKKNQNQFIITIRDMNSQTLVHKSGNEIFFLIIKHNVIFF